MMHFYSQFSFRITNGCEFANSGCKYFFLIRKFGRIRYSHLLYAFTFYLLPFTLLSQSVGIFGSTNLGVNNTGAKGNLSSVFDISSTSKGLLIPRVTLCQRTTAGCAGGMLDISGNLPAAAQGLLVYQTDATEGFYYNTSTTTIPSWILISAGSGPWTKSGGNVYLTNPTDKVGIGITSAGTKLWMQADAECVAVSYVASDVTGPMGFGSLRARGTLAAPSPVQAGDQLGAFSFSGYDGVALGTPTAAITASATENFSGTNKGSQLHFSTTLNGSASMTPGMTLDHNGYLGIGTMGPASKLHIHDAGTSALSISTNTNLGIGNDVELIFKSDLDGTPNPATIGQYNDGALRFSGQANLVTPDMIIADDGMIGIGTTVPLSKIHVYGTFDPIQIMVENTGGAFKTGYRLKTGTGEWFMGQVNPSTFSIKDITANKVRVEIDALGNVGIGTTAPVELLDVAGRLRIAPLAAPGATAEKLYNVGGNLFWDGVQLNSGSSGWSLLGNAGTVDVTNFIGTTDDVPFNFRVNGIESGRIESDNGTNTGGNTFLGYYAGSSNAVNVGLNEGLYNTAVGNAALWSNTIGYGNNAFGSYALNSNISGNGNLAIGGSALFSNLSGNDNIAVGSGALYSNIASAGNIAIGNNALFNNKMGNNATAVGTNAMQYANDQVVGFENNNVALGYEALRGSLTPSDNTGNNNTALGYQTLLNNTSGVYNTAIGNMTLRSNTTGASNTSSGYRALYSNTDGYSNTASGVNALELNTRGFWNIAMGEEALKNNSTASRNVAIGNQALYSQSFSNGAVPWNSNNVAVGSRALYFNQPNDVTTGIQNTAVGTEAMYFNTSGRFNTALGYRALYNFNDPAKGDNTAIGNEALHDNLSGGANTATGDFALHGNTIGDWNTATGTFAGDFITTGSGNTFIGYDADATLISINRSVAIGYNSKVDASNSMILGGTGVDAVNVGIGTSLPLATLDITGDGGTVLLPRKSSAGDPAGAANGMIYYNANSNKFRIYENGAWKDWVTPAGNPSWELSGNAGTADDGTYFIGTTDDIPFTIRVNNQKSGRIETNSGTGNNNANTFLGYFAGNSKTTGSGNTASGLSSLFSTTTGGGNTAYGVQALYSNVAGSNATAVGFYAMRYANDQGGAFPNYNVAVGYEALRGSATPANNTGNRNTALGYQTLLGNTSGSDNIAGGYQALYANTIGSENSALGNFSLNQNTIGYRNSAFGILALSDNIDGSYNTANGSLSLRYNQMGNNNSAYGYQALFSNKAGSNATAIGYNAMYYANDQAGAFTNYNVSVGYEALRGSVTPANNFGNQNTAIGYQSLKNNADGDDNTSIGNQSGTGNTSGDFNSFVGSLSGTGNTTGSSNTFMGYQAGYSNVGASDNSFFGRQAGANNNSGFSNSFFGSYAGFNSNGDNNSFFGFGAGNNVNTGAGNTAFGRSAGGGNLTAGANNTFIGYNADLASATQRTNATAIGYNAKVDADNALVLGGTGANAVNVGIGTTTPFTHLHVASNTMGTSIALQIASSAGMQGGFSMVRNRGTMAAPTAVQTNDALGSFGFIGYDGVAFGAGGTNAEIIATASENFTGTAHGTDMLFITTPNGSASSLERMRITNYGRLVIGNNTGAIDPEKKLMLANNTAASDNVSMGLIAGTTGINTIYMGHSGNENLGVIRYNNSTNTLDFWTNNTPNRIKIDGSGNVTIPSLIGPGTVNADGSGNLSVAALPSGASAWTKSGGNVYTTTLSDVVGIGTSSPSQKLDVVNSAGQSLLSIDGTANTGILMKTSGTTNWEMYHNNAQSALYFYSNSLGDAPLVIKNAGNVGIGTTNPTQKLHVYQNTDADKNVVYGYARQPGSTSDYQNTGVTGFGEGTAPAGWGYGIGVKGIGSTNSYGGIGLYGSIGSSIPSVSVPNAFYALYADAGAAAVTKYAGVFMNGNVGIGVANPTNLLHLVRSATAAESNIYSYLTTTSGGGINTPLRTEVAGSGAGNVWGSYNLSSSSGTGSVVGVLGYTTGANSGEKIGGDFGAAGTAGNNYAIRGFATGATAGANTGGYFSASGATNNYAIIVPSTGGNVGIGTTSPSYKLHSTTAIQGDRAIYGENTNSGTGVNNYGVYGYSVAAAPGYGYGGYFEGNFRGVHAVANSVSATQSSHAVFADNIGVTTSGSKIGVYGRSTGASTGRNTGVYGEASGSTGDNYGGYFKGNVNVDNFINYSKGTIVLGVPNGANNDVDINSTLAQQHTYYTTENATGAFSISGFTGGIDGRMLIVHNTSGNNMTITNLGASGASNQIMTNGAAAVTTGQGTATFIYDLTLAKWILISFSP